LRLGFAVGFLLAHGFSAGESASTLGDYVFTKQSKVFQLSMDPYIVAQLAGFLVGLVVVCIILFTLGRIGSALCRTKRVAALMEWIDHKMRADDSSKG